MKIASFSMRTKAIVAIFIIAALLLIVLVIRPFGGGGVDINSIPYQKGYDNASYPAGLIPGIDYDCDVQWYAYADFGGPYSQNYKNAFIAGCQAYQDSH